MPDDQGLPEKTRFDNQCPWNKGKLVGQKPPVKPKHVWAIRTRLQLRDRSRDLAMFNLAIDSKLRGCDLLRMTVEDVTPYGTVKHRATIRQQKTGRPVQFEITEHTRQALDSWIKMAAKRHRDYLFTGRRNPATHLTTRQYARLVADWIASIGLAPDAYGTHSLRRTKATLIYRRTGNLRAVQLAAAYAEASRFRDAVNAQERAVSIARAEGSSASDIADMEDRLRLYRQGRPYREKR